MFKKILFLRAWLESHLNTGKAVPGNMSARRRMPRLYYMDLSGVGAAGRKLLGARYADSWEMFPQLKFISAKLRCPEIDYWLFSDFTLGMVAQKHRSLTKMRKPYFGEWFSLLRDMAPSTVDGLN